VKFGIKRSNKTPMNKITHSCENITPFGGLNFVYNAMNRMGLHEFLDKVIGSRSLMAKYTFGDIIYSLFGNTLTQGSFVADVQILKAKFSNQTFDRIPSPDTIEYASQELKKESRIVTTTKGVIHEINENAHLNKALIALAVKTKQLRPDKEHTLDYDNVVIEHEKQDAKYSYKSSKGYHPGIAFIDRIPVHIENRNGNTPASYGQEEVLQKCFENLASFNIKVKNFRADCASYQKAVIELAVKHTDNFFIRMLDFEGIRELCGQIKEWQTVEVNCEKKEVTSILYKPFKEDKEYRVVVIRKQKKDQQMDLLSGTAYSYQGIITNNVAMTEKEVIEFYNQRGDAENSNRYLLNDFNLHHLPFMDLDTNTIYMYFMAMCATLFEWIKEVLVKNKTKTIDVKMRTKAVCFHYITVATKFVKHAREKILRVYSSSQNYCILKI